MSLDLDAAAKMLYIMEPLRRPVMQAIIIAANLPGGGCGLDVGCGIGLQTLLLAQATGPKGHVTGMDISTSFLDTARVLARQAGMADRVSFQPGSWDQLTSGEQTFDWVWSMDAVGYAPGESVSIIGALARLIKPGGRLILGYWSSQCLLPGYPALEARLNASPAGIAPFVAGSTPDAHFLYTLRWMQQAGLVNTRAETFVHTVAAPLAPDLQKALTELLVMRWGSAGNDVSTEDWQTCQRLCRAESPDFILNRPGYCAFFTYSVFQGSVPEK